MKKNQPDILLSLMLLNDAIMSIEVTGILFLRIYIYSLFSAL